MRKRFLLSIFLINIFSLVFSRNTFQKIFTSDYDVECFGAYPETTGGYIITGIAQVSSTAYNVFMTRTDCQGSDIPGIRTPSFKTNVSISNRNLAKNLGFMLNCRWTDAVDNWSNVTSIDNNLPAYNIIDAQMNYRITKAATTIKAGASNLLNFYHQDYSQGISVGGIYYISLLYDGIFK
jgi:hypothetical protein